MTRLLGIRFFRPPSQGPGPQEVKVETDKKSHLPLQQPEHRTDFLYNTMKQFKDLRKGGEKEKTNDFSLSQLLQIYPKSSRLELCLMGYN